MTEATDANGAAGLDDISIILHVNGEWCALNIPPQRMPLDCLRYDFGTDWLDGYCIGVCGVSTVHINGHLVRSCLQLAAWKGSSKHAAALSLGWPFRQDRRAAKCNRELVSEILIDHAFERLTVAQPG